jgi:Leucine-rich repeat (LRR) protein
MEASASPQESGHSPGNVHFEVEGVGGEKKALNKCKRCKLVWSWESSFIVFMGVFMAGLHFYTFSLYTGFKHFQRAGVWVFPLLSLLALAFVVQFVLSAFLPGPLCKPRKTDPRKKKRKTRPSVSHKIMEEIILGFNSFASINGKYYLTKMYTCEALEHVQQVYSLTTFYVCVMPVHISVFLCAILTVELSINIWATLTSPSEMTKNQLLLLDIFTDCFCVVFPLMYTWLAFRIPMSINDLLVLATYPTLSLLSKLYDMGQNVLAQGALKIIETEKKEKSAKGKRKQSASFQQQLEHFPKWLRHCFAFLNVCFVLFFVSLCSVHLATQPSSKECSSMFTKPIWEGCKLSVPFCQNPFLAKCDCAVLEISNYTESALPESFDKLSSLAKLGIYQGELQLLPSSFGGNHNKLLVLMVIGNKLKTLPKSIGEIDNLVILSVFNNQISFLPDSIGKLDNLVHIWLFNNQLNTLPKSIGNLENLVQLMVFNNQLHSLPESITKLQKLTYLWAFNNQLRSLPLGVGQLQSLQYLEVFRNRLTSLPDSICDFSNLNILHVSNNHLAGLPECFGQLKKLSVLYLYNNRLTSLPDSIGDLNNLEHLYAWNNTLVALPSSIGKLKSLIWLDVRQNRLQGLPSSISQCSSIKYFYINGNPVCDNLKLPDNLKHSSGLCEQQCSTDCPEHWRYDGSCDDNDYTYQFLKRTRVAHVPYAVKPKPDSGCNTKLCADEACINAGAVTTRNTDQLAYRARRLEDFQKFSCKLDSFVTSHVQDVTDGAAISMSCKDAHITTNRRRTRLLAIDRRESGGSWS